MYYCDYCGARTKDAVIRKEYNRKQQLLAENTMCYECYDDQVFGGKP